MCNAFKEQVYWRDSMTWLIQCGMGNKGHGIISKCKSKSVYSRMFWQNVPYVRLSSHLSTIYGHQTKQKKIMVFRVGRWFWRWATHKGQGLLYIYLNLLPWRGAQRVSQHAFSFSPKIKHATYSLTCTHTLFFFCFSDFFFTFFFSLFSCQRPHPLLALFSPFLSTGSFTPCVTLPSTTSSSPSKPSM